MSTQETIADLRAELQRSCPGRLVEPADAPELALDFGRLELRRPALAFLPREESDVLHAVRGAAERGVSVVARGSGHSQSGQGLGAGLVLDMRGLSGVVEIDLEQQCVVARGGTEWRAVVDRTFERGLMPIGLTHILNPTVGGTLSMGGVGAESFRVGAQVDNVRFLDVVTPESDAILRCSADQNRELFDAVRSGLGQCGVIVRAGYPLRRCGARVRNHYLAYFDPGTFLEDLEKVCDEQRVDHLCGLLALRHAPFDPWGQAEGRDTAPRMLILVLGKEFDDADSLDDATTLGGLRFDQELRTFDTPLWSASGTPGHMFFAVYEPPTEGLDADETTLHPWVDLVFDRPLATTALDFLLDPKNPPGELFQNIIVCMRRPEQRAPLLSIPGGVSTSQGNETRFGVGLFPSARPEDRDRVLQLMSAHSRRWCERGGKRYLSGYLPFDTQADWTEHYGPAWRTFRDAKDRFDPRRILNPQVIPWD